MKFISKSLWMELGYANVVKNALSCWSGGRVKKTVEAYGISFRRVYFGLYFDERNQRFFGGKAEPRHRLNI